MSSAALVLSLLGLSASALDSQATTLKLDPDGNYSPAVNRADLRSAPGPDTPGALLRTFQISNFSPLTGFAPRQDVPGQWAAFSGGGAEAFLMDINGLVESTMPLSDPNDAWVGHDGARSSLIFVNAFDDTISSYLYPSGFQQFRLSLPTSGPSGLAHDVFRDIYWYCDWTTNELIGIDASELYSSNVVTIVDRFSVANKISRLAGVAYNCLDDTLVCGGRDQGAQVAFNVANKNVVAFWPTLGVSFNDPQGCALSPESGVTTTDFLDLQSRVHEGTQGVLPNVSVVRIVPNGIRATLTNYANNDTFGIVAWSPDCDRRVIKGIQTCLGSQLRLGFVFLSGFPPRGTIDIFNLPPGGTVYVEGAVRPSNEVSGVRCIVPP